MLKTFMLRKLMLKKLGMMLLAVSISALLSSCLVDKQKVVEKIARTTDTLRIYQDNDWIDYNVIEIDLASGTNRYGTMRTIWKSSADIHDPIDGSPISPDLKETTTITYDDNYTGDPNAIATRYISQVKTAPMVSGDPGIGSIILHAIDDELDADYWPYPDGVTPSTSPVISPVIFKSPLFIGSSFPASFSIMECSLGQCAQPIYNFTDTNFDVLGDTDEVTTNLGIFSNPFRLHFYGNTVRTADAPAVSLLGDIRDACGTSDDNINHTGDMFVVPEIGMIKMISECKNNTSGAYVRYIISATDTSFNFQ